MERRVNAPDMLTVENLEIPPDLEIAFAEHPGSAQNFEAFPRWVKRAILEWILTAKREATRARNRRYGAIGSRKPTSKTVSVTMT